MTDCTFCGEFVWDETKYVPGRMVINLRKGVTILLCNECRKALLERENKAAWWHIDAISDAVLFGSSDIEDVTDWFDKECPRGGEEDPYLAFKKFSMSKRVNSDA